MPGAPRVQSSNSVSYARSCILFMRLISEVFDQFLFAEVVVVAYLQYNIIWIRSVMGGVCVSVCFG